MSHGAFQPAPDAPRFSFDAAVAYFAAGCKPRAEARVGVELECFLIDAQSGAMCAYDAIVRVLHALADRYGWTPLLEGDHWLGLQRNGTMVTLEPGGQVELATRPVVDIHALRQECDEFLDELRNVLPPLGLNALSMGLHPTADFRRVPLIPKERYAVMAPQLEAVGPLAHYMMRGTCGWQCAIDYESERDFQQKFRGLYHVTSFISAVFANSPWEQGADNGFASKRMAVWLETDAARCGLIPGVFQDGFDFEAYARYAFQMPMLFLVRQDRWLALPRPAFSAFLRDGYDQWYATREDWQLHLTSLFPEVRLKQYIEWRGADAHRFEYLYALPALILGVTAAGHLLDAACDLTRRLSWEERLALHLAVARDGLAARCGRHRVAALVAELVAIARNGLELRGRGEAVYLDAITEALARFHVPTVPPVPRRLTPQDRAAYVLVQ
ncbi:MAG: glutamate--cysteine ligase [Deltaproteobacteria bacterium]|nr:glutamate--cysteine ligase [Deltaproteobacteria bacterium]